LQLAVESFCGRGSDSTAVDAVPAGVQLIIVAKQLLAASARKNRVTDATA
jgi:hypothetical protein